MGCQGSKTSNSEVLPNKLNENVNTGLLVKGILVPNTSISKIEDSYKKQTNPDEDFERLCMWCIVNIEDSIVQKLYNEEWNLGSECHSMNDKNKSKNYRYLYKYRKDYQVFEKQPLSLEDDLNLDYKWLSKSIFIQHHNLDIIKLQEKEGWVLGNHSENFNYELTKDCWYYLFKSKNTFNKYNCNFEIVE